MNQEKEAMQTASSAGEYLAPKVKVLEIKARRVMCTSPENEGYERTTSDWEED